jgi:hypothetical protein
MSDEVSEVRIQHEKGEDVMGDKVVVGTDIDGQDSKAVDGFNFRIWKGEAR